jgi:hypothetical protein
VFAVVSVGLVEVLAALATVVVWPDEELMPFVVAADVPRDGLALGSTTAASPFEVSLLQAKTSRPTVTLNCDPARLNMCSIMPTTREFDRKKLATLRKEDIHRALSLDSGGLNRESVAARLQATETVALACD